MNQAQGKGPRLLAFTRALTLGEGHGFIGGTILIGLFPVLKHLSCDAKGKVQHLDERGLDKMLRTYESHSRGITKVRAQSGAIFVGILSAFGCVTARNTHGIGEQSWDQRRCASSTGES